jgi:hypothetical protein
MGEFVFFKKKKKDQSERDSDLLEGLDVDLDSDHPVHEEFVSDKRIREMKKKKLIRE